MQAKELVRELAGLKIDTGYTFENGVPFQEPLGSERAEALLHVLQDCGVPLQPEAPSDATNKGRDTH